MNEIVIHIYENSEGGYNYELYTSEEAFTESEGEGDIESGTCTGTLQEAVSMATDHLQRELVRIQMNSDANWPEGNRFGEQINRKQNE